MLPSKITLLELKEGEDSSLDTFSKIPRAVHKKDSDSRKISRTMIYMKQSEGEIQ